MERRKWDQGKLKPTKPVVLIKVQPFFSVKCYQISGSLRLIFRVLENADFDFPFFRISHRLDAEEDTGSFLLHGSR